ncbi:hypothetical protein ALC53_06323 [Atta colombica]|uniref:Uncharacterized protein n=1 Tax=Atta colombica TaxID=520822 RepID=A0A195BEQ7_9HYME|nr:hypothetical protein ALC53_06323 [Atta colombica]
MDEGRDMKSRRWREELVAFDSKWTCLASVAQVTYYRDSTIGVTMALHLLASEIDGARLQVQLNQLRTLDSVKAAITEQLCMQRHVETCCCETELRYRDLSVETLAFILLLRFTWKSSSRKRNQDNTSAKLTEGTIIRKKGQGTRRADEGVLRDCEHGGPAASYPRLGGAYARTTIRAPLRALNFVFVPKS